MYPDFPVNPESLRDYFNNNNQWEEYCRQYETWMSNIGNKGIPIFKKPTSRIRCKGCGKFMSLFNSHIHALSGDWHMKEACLEKLFAYLMDNKLFSFNK